MNPPLRSKPKYIGRAFNLVSQAGLFDNKLRATKLLPSKLLTIKSLAFI